MLDFELKSQILRKKIIKFLTAKLMMIDNHMKIFGQIAFQFICEKFIFTALKYLHLKLNQDKEVLKMWTCSKEQIIYLLLYIGSKVFK